MKNIMKWTGAMKNIMKWTGTTDAEIEAALAADLVVFPAEMLTGTSANPDEIIHALARGGCGTACGGGGIIFGDESEGGTGPVSCPECRRLMPGHISIVGVWSAKLETWLRPGGGRHCPHHKPTPNTVMMLDYGGRYVCRVCGQAQ